MYTYCHPVSIAIPSYSSVHVRTSKREFRPEKPRSLMMIGAKVDTGGHQHQIVRCGDVVATLNLPGPLATSIVNLMSVSGSVSRSSRCSGLALISILTP